MKLSQFKLVTRVVADRERLLSDLDRLVSNPKAYTAQAYMSAVQDKLDLIGGAEMTLIDLGVAIDDTLTIPGLDDALTIARFPLASQAAA